ncbi:MAG: hypothetical protein V9F01_15085 [Chitinophagaceae bacterium]
MNILIAVENGFSARYILRTSILDKLLQEDHKIVVVSPNANEAYFSEWLSKKGITVIAPPALKAGSGRNLQSLLELVRYYGMPNTDSGANIEIKYRDYLNRHPMRPLFLNTFSAAVQAHRKYRGIRAILIKIGNLYDVGAYRAIIKEHKVSLLVLDGIGSTGPHVSNWARAAYKLCSSVTVITNWDHPTTKGYRSVPTDRYLVWGQPMSDELVRYQDIPQERIRKVGSVLFDHYFNDGVLLDRSSVCIKLGLDEARPIVLYISNSPINFPHNLDIVQFLFNFLDDLPSKPQLLVRLHPLYAIPGAANEIAEHKKFALENKITYSIPHVLSNVLMPDMEMDEIILSNSLIKSADVVVNMFSTMQLDACMCDKPTINIGFDWGEGGTKYPESQPLRELHSFKKNKLYESS